MVAGVENKDRTILAERHTFQQIVHPIVPEVLKEDGYFKDILRLLIQNNKK